jgi:hypothetical protein
MRFSNTIPFLASLSLAFVADPAWARKPEARGDLGSFKITNFDFKTLYNDYRLAQPKLTPWAGSYFPFSEDGIAAASEDDDTPSTAEKFDAHFKLKSRTRDYESDSHSCTGLEGPTAADCDGWYGHCNGWAGAAIREPEPRAPFTVDGTEFSVADQKGLLSEMWLDATTLIVGWSPKGDATGPWVFDPKNPISQKKLSSTVTNYDAFWDPSPRAFFLIFGNYIGLNRVGLVIDRFTGDAVWNQPVAGYRTSTLKPEDLGSIEKNGKTLYFAKLTTEVFWASDEVEPGHLSTPFDIRQADAHGEDYVGRKLSYKLFFDAPVKLDAQGAVVSAGKIVGPGIWAHQEDSKLVEDIDQSHPDFIWLPTDFYVRSQYGNPLVKASRVYQLFKDHAPLAGRPLPVEKEPVDYVVTIQLQSFPKGSETKPTRYFTDMMVPGLRRNGIDAWFASSKLELRPDSIQVPISVLGGASLKQVYAALDRAGFKRLYEH